MDPGYITSWQEAEDNAIAWMRQNGFSDARGTAGGADGGIDVRSRNALAQVKREAAQVGRPAVQRLVGARGRGIEDLLFFSAAGYSRTAVEYANDVGVGLFTYDVQGGVTPVNARAEHLIALGKQGEKGLLSAKVKERIAWFGFALFLLGLLALGNMLFQVGRDIFAGGHWVDAWYDIPLTVVLSAAFVLSGSKLMRLDPTWKL